MRDIQPRRVLIVDDEPMISDSLAMIFTRAGYEARAAYSAEHALALIELWPPDLAILDVYLPGMNGIDLAIHLKAHLPGCKLVLFSGQSATSDLLEQARRDGHLLEVMAKPVHPDELLRLVAANTSN
jgi:DNA-binding NtrC family response regulator